MVKKYFEGYKKSVENFPAERVKAAIANRDEVIPELLEILDDVLENADDIVYDEDKYAVYVIAVYLLAYFREAQSCGKIVSITAHPEYSMDFIEHLIMCRLDGIFASVYNGNTDYLKSMIENPETNELVRGKAISALVILLKNGQITRDELVGYFKELFEGKLQREPDFVWDDLIMCCNDIHPKEFEQQIKMAYRDGLVNRSVIKEEKVQTQLGRSLEEVLEDLQNDDGYDLVRDECLAVIEKFYCFNTDEPDDEHWKKDIESLNLMEAQFSKKRAGINASASENQTIQRESFIGRNDPCPCGSGKKYKKCCLN